MTEKTPNHVKRPPRRNFRNARRNAWSLLDREPSCSTTRGIGSARLADVESTPSELQSEKPLVASLLLVAMPGAPSSFLLLVVRPGAPSSVLAASSKAKRKLGQVSLQWYKLTCFVSPILSFKLNLHLSICWGVLPSPSQRGEGSHQEPCLMHWTMKLACY